MINEVSTYTYILLLYIWSNDFFFILLQKSELIWTKTIKSSVSTGQ